MFDRQPTAQTNGPRLDEVGEFLTTRHDKEVTDLELLHGGFWSAAYGYRVDDRGLVLRLGQNSEWFEIDRAAMAHNGPDLPVPEVLEIGEAFGGAYAVSVRHYGRFLEAVTPHEADIVGPTIVRFLTALKAAPSQPTSSSWRDWLMRGLIDDPNSPQHGWRTTLADDPALDSLFRSCESRVGELAASCPERGDLVHGDLLHSNVLVSEDASRVNAVFSWKCSKRGDFLFDVAWCTFCGGAFHPGIGAADVFGRIVTAPSITADPRALTDAAERHHCYELHIGATSLGWNIWVGNEQALRAVADYTAEILKRGPLAAGNR